MSSYKTENCPPEHSSGDTPEFKVLSAKEALRRDLRTLEVPAGADVMFSPYEREFADYFARVEVKNFDDLKTLGFVPRGLTEEKVRRAIADDDDEAYKVAQARLSNSPTGDHYCECRQSQPARASFSNLRQHYASARQRFNPALARVLSENLQTRIDWDSPIAGIVRGWMGHLELYPKSAISLAFLSDITIERGAVLRVDQSTKGLLVGTIYIHRTGRLIYGGGYLKIWAYAISNLTNITRSVTALENIPWLAHTT